MPYNSAHRNLILANSFVLRPSTSSTLPSSDSSAFQPPTPEELLGQWFIVHTSLPFWRNKCNIKIAYSVLPSPVRPTDLVNDTVTYQDLNSDKLKTVQGVNTVAQSEQQGAWDWRGTGWVKVVSNHWEILAHGCREGGDESYWIVVHTQKSFFTPAAIHVYSRNKEMLPEETWEALMTALSQCQDLKDLIANVFPVRQD